MSNDLKSRYDAGIELAQKAAKIAMGYYETALDIEWKNDESPVTVADREAEKFLRTSLNKYFKQDGFLGREQESVLFEDGIIKGIRTQMQADHTSFANCLLYTSDAADE